MNISQYDWEHEKMSSRNWHEEREQWEQDRALYELELQKAYAEASNRRARWLMAVFACHAHNCYAGGWLAGVSGCFSCSCKRSLAITCSHY